MNKDIVITYKPPKEKFDYDDFWTWPKIFFTDTFECPEKLDLHLKINKLKQLYHMEDYYIDIQYIDK